MNKLIWRLVLLLVLVVSSLLLFPVLVLAATPGLSGDALTVSTALVVLWGYAAPFTVYRWIKKDGAAMKGITVGFCVLAAIVALLVGGGIHPDFSTGAGIYAFGLMVYGEQQLVWTLFKDRYPQAVR